MTVLELPRPARVRAKILAGICLAAAGCGTPHEESDVRASWEQPADLAVLRVRIPLGSLTVHATEPGSISLSGRARKTARDDDS